MTPSASSEFAENDKESEVHNNCMIYLMIIITTLGEFSIVGLPIIIEEKTNQTKSQQIKPNKVLVLGERGEPDNLEKTLSKQSREPTNSTRAHVWH